MEVDSETEEKRNDALSQSYIECVGRVAQQNNDNGIKFELPREILEKREKGWDNFFNKYADEASDDIELNIETMEPVAPEEEDDDDDEEEEDDEEPGDYYSKCRAPMRKLPALIQYWIDTGNPPYQLIGGDDNSGTGSSLSEGEPSRTGHSDVLRESSSVDTTAYILSNKNVTKKSRTAAIVEGAKKPADPQIDKSSPQKNILPLQKDLILSKETIALKKRTISSSSTEHDVKTIPNLTSNLTGSSSAKNHTSTTAQKNSSNNLLNSSASSQNQSVKLSQVLPTFCQIEDLLDESKKIKSPINRSPPLRELRTEIASLSEIRSNPKIFGTLPSDDDPMISRSSQSSSVFPNSTRKSVNRRKLYTGRNSPIDLILERTSIDSVEKTSNFLHPALQPNFPEKSKTSRPRSRRKRKRPLQSSQTMVQDRNSSQDSLTPVLIKKPKGEMRYEDFFESLGLTPSKTIIGATLVRKTLPKRLKTIDKRVKPQKLRENVHPCNTAESSIKETGDTSQTEDSISSPDARRPKAQNLLGEKILCLKIDRLSESYLARYRHHEKSTRDSKMEIDSVEDDRKIDTGSSNSSSSKKVPSSISENIELLTTATQDSDSSTILIIACNNDNNGQYSDSDNSLFTRNPLKMRKKSSLLEKRASPTLAKRNQVPIKTDSVTRNFGQVSVTPKATRNGEKSVDKSSDKMTNLLEVSVRLEKIDMDSATPDGTAVRKFTLESSYSKNSPARTRNSKDHVVQSSDNKQEKTKNKWFTLGSNLVNEVDEIPRKLRKLNATPVRCSSGTSILWEEDEDSFVKLVEDLGTEIRSTKTVTEETKQANEDVLENGKLTTSSSKMRTKFHTNFEISVSSDEENDVSIKKVQKNWLNRRTTDDLMNGDERTRLNNLEESNRRRNTKIEKMQENPETNVVESIRRSTRTHKPPSWGDNTDYSASIFSSDEPKTGRNIFTNSKELSMADKQVLLASENRQTRSKIKINSKSDESRSQKTPLTKNKRWRRDVKTSNLMRFETRLDSDSDSEFELLRFSINPNYNEQKEVFEIPKINYLEFSENNEANTEETKELRTSPRRTLNKSIELRENSRTKVPKTETKSFGGLPTNSEKNSTPAKTGPTQLTSPKNNRARNESAPKTIHKSPKSKIEQQEKPVVSKKSLKTERSKKASKVSPPKKAPTLIANHSDSKSSKRKLHTTKILGTPMESESDDDVERIVQKRDTSETYGRGKTKYSNGTSSNESNDKNSRNDQNSLKKRRETSKTLFGTSPNDSVDDIDLVFTNVPKSRARNCNVVINSLKFVSGNKHKKFNSARQSTISFRTKLRSDSDNDDVL